MDLTDDQWAVLAPLLPVQKRRRDGKGRPRRDARSIFDGILWVLRTGAPWHDLPHRYPPYQTCHRRLQEWVHDGVLELLLRRLAEDLRDRGKLDLTEAFIDGSHAGAKRGVLWLGGLAAARRPRSWQWQTATAFLSPLGLQVVSDMKRSSSLSLSNCAS